MVPNALEAELATRGARGAKALTALPDDVLLLIVSFIRVKDIISLRKTCLKLYRLTKLRWVWSDAVKRHVIDKGLPVPAADGNIKLLSAQHLETRAVHAAKFNDNWHSPQPKPRGAIEFRLDNAAADGAPAVVSQVLFLTGRCGEFLITLTGKTMECWEVPLDASGAYRIAEWTDEHGIEEIMVNQDPKHDVELAYRGPAPNVDGGTIVYTMSLDTFHGRFKPRSAVSGPRLAMEPLHAMYGDYIVMGDPLLVWYARGHGMKAMTTMINDAQLMFNEVLAVKLIEHYTFVVRAKTIEVYAFPRYSPTELKWSEPGRIVSLLAFDTEPAREAVIVTRAKGLFHPGTTPQRLSDSVTVLLLHCVNDEGVDAMTQLDFLPYRPGEEAIKDGKFVPVKMPAEVTRVFKIAPSTCKLRVAPGGKGFWIQTHNVKNRHSVYPARCLMGFDVRPVQQDPAAPLSHSSHADIMMLKSKPAHLHDANDFHICKSQVYARRCDMSEILRKKYSVMTADLEDTVGRIAIGDRYGKIEVLDYV